VRLIARGGRVDGVVTRVVVVVRLLSSLGWICCGVDGRLPHVPVLLPDSSAWMVMMSRSVCQSRVWSESSFPVVHRRSPPPLPHPDRHQFLPRGQVRIGSGLWVVACCCCCLVFWFFGSFLLGDCCGWLWLVVVSLDLRQHPAEWNLCQAHLLNASQLRQLIKLATP
jgi:hypothetical protein